jgi:arabinan endo-1,5-alpha-L-arabinosidase
VTGAGGGVTHYNRLVGGEQQDYIQFYRQLGRDFGVRIPRERHKPAPSGGAEPHWRPLTAENLSPQILAGYGDPAVLKTDDCWYLVTTSNDAPNAFPILRSVDLASWEPLGFVFPKARRRNGRPWADMSATSGLQRWRGSATSIGSVTPPARRTMRSPSASPRAGAQPGRGAISADL